jgi:hypothetical protein
MVEQRKQREAEEKKQKERQQKKALQTGWWKRFKGLFRD